MGSNDMTSAPAPTAGSARPARGDRFLEQVTASVGQAVVGADRPLRLLATALLAGGHALVEDVPGVGKTLLARAFATSLGLAFSRIQGTPDLLPTDVTGSSILEGQQFRFVPGPVFTNVLLVDEINRATPRTQSALLEAMQERQVSAEGETRPLPDPFLVLATQNPVELEGTFALPEAQLDRFLLRIELGYPEEEAERRIAARYQASAEPMEQVHAVAAADDVGALREAARTVRVSEDVERYLVALVRATRESEDVRLGASPRSSVSLYRAAQAWALLDGRDFVLPDDVRDLAHAVLEHRLLLDVDRELRGATVRGVVEAVLDEVPLPLAEENG
jgi:MoxR-like ATPase